ncbi:hypothetical protein MKZ38_001975 [Zalerion maritima]|uniref:Structural maintenance of chromosomes protein n=1 Tax=Zalerion maritima TaxID=339359 RepID=A0AAD5RQU0_9PEZI|nr:hypothetical protein MKZ38_001975 [Zalerion maritima]
MGKLIRLELFNFKSYKGHHTLLFGDSYFTSIIGPNGSGKSNSMDAISFVLGIKSSHLRSAQMRDLVYRGRVLKTSKINDDGSAVDAAANGTGDASQKSRGDPKTAWVMAVYEDDAGDEQKWKRSITNSGASEYRINDRVVTAQQYNDALEMENILIKARNFLVFQGDVEAIAAQSPQDLTRLVEQISGSLEYKAEYERLQTEVERASENQADKLHRRRGINSEIKQFQEQKKEAENFQKKTDERDAAIVTQKLWRIYHLQKQMDEASAEIQEHQENLKEFRRNADAAQKALDDARKEQASVGREVGKIEREMKAHQRSVEEQESQLVPIEEKVQQSTTQSTEIRKRVEKISREYEKQEEEIRKTEKDLAIIEKARQKFEDEWKEMMKQQGKELSEKDHKEYRTTKQQVMAKSASNKSQLDTLVRQLKIDEVTVNGLTGKVDTIKSVEEKLERELADIKERKETTQSAVQDLSHEIDEIKTRLNQIRSKRTQTDQRRRELEEQLNDALNKIAESTDSRRQSEKEREFKERVTNLKRMFPGVKGRVSDTCKAKQKKYEQAVITAMGHNFDSVIVDSVKTGNECIQHLKDQRLPRMTFIPLENIKTSPVNAAIKGIQGARLAIDTIDYDPALERAITYACGGSVVCDSFDVAKHIVHNKRIQVKAVDLVGNVVHKNGIMTGGKGPEHKGKQRRFEVHDMQNLEKVVAKIRDDLSKLPRAEHRDQDEEELKNELEGLHQRLKFAKSELAAFEKNYNSKMKQLRHEQRQLAEIEPKLEAEEAKLAKSRQAVKKFEAAITKVEDQMFVSFCKRLGYADIRAYEAQQGSIEEEAASKRTAFEVQKQALTSNLTWQQKRQADLKERGKQMQKNLKRLENDLQGYEKEKQKINKNVSKVKAALEALDERLAEIQEEHQEKVDEVGAAKAEVQERTREIELRMKAVAALETEVRKTSGMLFEQLRRCKMDQIQLPLSKGSLDNLPIKDTLLQEDPDAMDVDDEEDDVQADSLEDYGIAIDFDSLDKDLKNSDDQEEEDKLQDKIDILSSELDQLNPNMRATKSLEAVEARLKATEKDFEDARTALKNAKDSFAEIKKKRFDLFNRAFMHIQDQITHVYRDLTRTEAYPLGGSAYLDIEEDTDTPYLSGIKYHAMPPLKRFRDMELLSGGEKTMAALALLFAIHSFQPSPFFVLDEVDAALDNANVEKIKKYIAEHAGPGMQFIVISLKTGLFQDSQSLIGVYRDQDVNSSRTLTLDLRKYV